MSSRILRIKSHLLPTPTATQPCCCCTGNSVPLVLVECSSNPGGGSNPRKTPQDRRLQNQLPDSVVQQMMDVAFAARNNSWSPYSKFRVGAAVLDSGGKIHAGTNVENATYGLTICAERSALVSAVSNGAKGIRAVLCCTDVDECLWACAACCGVILEFGDDVLVYAVKHDRTYQCKGIRELLPFSFGRADMGV
mmetsp:Transcript_50774/g.99518  ORF Transcript_50774/g.99518 Transcript_50774/m.99518 type:complete len:194 (+) Transcript_50774:24-605(+)